MSAVAASKIPVQTILIHTPDGKTRTFPLDRDRFTLGRAGNNELCYPDDAGLSRQHLALEKTGDSWTIRHGQQERHLRERESARSAAHSRPQRPDYRRPPDARIRKPCAI